MDLSQFERARKFFSELERQAVLSLNVEEVEVPIFVYRDEENLKSFTTATYAASVLYSLGKEQLLAHEQEGVIHSSTVSGGSLSATMDLINEYFNHGDAHLTKDRCEQVLRTLQSARTVLERTEGRYTPVF